MSLSNDLISQFVKVTNDKEEPKKESFCYGTIVEYEGTKYVKFDGSELLTPISSTADAKVDERVTIMIKNHQAIVTGNLSSPSSRKADVDDLSDQISAFEIVIADKVDTSELNAERARIDTLVSDNVLIRETLSANEASIETLESDNVTIKEKLTANEADIDSLKTTKLDAEVADLTYATIEGLDATNASIHNLESDYGSFKSLSTDKFTAIEGNITDLDTKKLSAEQADLKYANIDFSNIGEAAIEKVFADSGIIKDLVVSGGKITGELVGVTIKGDLIEGNTIKADKLVVKGSDGIYYKLNFEGGTFSEGEEVPTDGLHGSVIVANSITAEKIRVDDLVAFGATIGGFHITNDSLYSGVKSTVDNTTRGIYLDNNGQIAFGDSNSYIKYYQDQNGDYKLEISAGSILIGSSGKNVETIVDDAQSTADAAKATADDAQTTALRAESSIPQTANAVVIEALSGYVPFENVENEDGTVTEGYNSKIAALEARIKTTEGRVTTEVTNRTIANQGLQSQIEEITNRMVFDENGLTFKNITNGTESPYKINIDNDELKFLNGNEAVQTFDAYGNSVIPNLKVLTMLNLFGYVFSKDASGNLNLDYVGGDE